MKSPNGLHSSARRYFPELHHTMRLRCASAAALLGLLVGYAGPAAHAALPESATFADAVHELADTTRALQIDSWDELLAWREVLIMGPGEMASPGTARAVHGDLVRFLARRQPILKGPALELATPVSLLERLQIAALPAVAATGDRSYLPVLQSLYQQQMKKGNWHLVEEIRPVVRALNGDAPSRPIYDGPAYYQWLKQRGHYRTIQSLSNEPDLEERTPAGLTPLYVPPANSLTASGFTYDEARALRILDRLRVTVAPAALNENLRRWFQFGGVQGNEFRLSWALGDVRYYLTGVGDEPRVLVVLLDESFPGAVSLQASLGTTLNLPNPTLVNVPSEGRDVIQPAGPGRLLVGVRGCRQGHFTVLRFEWQ